MELTMIGAYVGMFMVLAAFAAETRGIVSSRSFNYLLLMAIGEVLLTVRAYVTGGKSVFSFFFSLPKSSMD